MKWFNISKIHIWWIRFFVLLIIGLPALFGWPLNQIAQSISKIYPLDKQTSGDFTVILVWFCYALFIWIIVFSSAGKKNFFEYISASFIFGLTTILLGSIFRQIFPFITGGLTNNEISIMMIMKLFVVLIVVPYAFLFINSFSAKGLINRVSNKKGKLKNIGLNCALILRVFQHAGEVVFNLMDIWKEEHPQKILPRHMRDWSLNWHSFAGIFPWVFSAVLAWVYAAMIHAFEPIPIMVDEVEKLLNKGVSDV